MFDDPASEIDIQHRRGGAGAAKLASVIQRIAIGVTPELQRVVVLSQAEYDALTPDSTTLYLIVG